MRRGDNLLGLFSTAAMDPGQDTKCAADSNGRPRKSSQVCQTRLRYYSKLKLFQPSEMIAMLRTYNKQSQGNDKSSSPIAIPKKQRGGTRFEDAESPSKPIDFALAKANGMNPFAELTRESDANAWPLANRR